MLSQTSMDRTIYTSRATLMAHLLSRKKRPFANLSVQTNQNEKIRVVLASMIAADDTN